MISFILPKTHQRVVMDWIRTNCETGSYGVTRSDGGAIIVSLTNEMDITHFRITFCDEMDGFLEL